jgi:hypothetical protein
MSSLNGSNVDLVVVLVCPDKANVDDARRIIDRYHQTVLIAPNIENHTVIAHKARIAVHIFDVRWRVPGGPFGVTIPCLEGFLGIGMLLPKEAKRFEGDNAHVDIIQCSHIGNNLRMDRRTRAWPIVRRHDTQAQECQRHCRTVGHWSGAADGGLHTGGTPGASQPPPEHDNGSDRHMVPRVCSPPSHGQPIPACGAHTTPAPHAPAARSRGARQGCTVAHCLAGVPIEGAGGHRVEGMTLRNNTADGLVTREGSNGNVVTLSSAHDNGESGFTTDSDGNAFTQNVARNNGEAGFLAGEGGNNNTFTHNIAQGNREVGFFVSGNSNTLNYNVPTQNSGDGIGVERNANTVTQNAVTSNGGDGIDVREDATGNILTENAAAGHRGVSDNPDDPINFDLEDDNTNCDANTWTRNVGSRNQNCIH